MTKSLWRRIFSGKWTLIPLGLTLLLSVFQVSQNSKTVAFGVLDSFMISNSFGLLLTLLFEVFKRWSTEDRMIKLTQHIDTHSPTFQQLVNLIEDADAVAKFANTFSVANDSRINPFVNHLQDRLVDWRRELEPLREGRIESRHSDNRLSLLLSKNAPRVYAVSVPKTDLPFWISPEGETYWAIQKNSPAMKATEARPIEEELGETGVFRVFVIQSTMSELELIELKRIILMQVRAGVNAKVYFDRGQLGYIWEGAIFGDYCIRETRLREIGGEAVNLYSFGKSEVARRIQDFQALWNASFMITSASSLRSDLADSDLSVVFRKSGFEFLIADKSPT